MLIELMRNARIENRPASDHTTDERAREAIGHLRPGHLWRNGRTEACSGVHVEVAYFPAEDRCVVTARGTGPHAQAGLRAADVGGAPPDEVLQAVKTALMRSLRDGYAYTVTSSPT